MARLKAFTMPKWGIEMSEGTIAEWMVAENAPFEKGTVLALIETDKITVEVADNHGWLGPFSLRPHVTIVKIPLTINATTGAYVYTPNVAALNALNADASETFTLDRKSVV